MTAVIVETPAVPVIKAEIIQNKVEGLDFRRFYGMMSMADFMVFEADVLAGRKTINDAHEISWK